MDHVAVITGGGRGIGLAIAHALAGTGAGLCLCARSENELAAAARDLSAKARVVTVTADISRVADVRRVFETARRELGPVDWLVNNAGVIERAPLSDLTEAQWDHTIDVNLKGPFLCAQAALPDLVARKGRIVNIGSISGTLGTPRAFAYNASKWGVNGLTLSWAEELKPQGVFVACVQPGSVDTQMLQGSGFPPDLPPEDIGRVVRFLLAEAPFSMTGAIVNAFG